MILKRTGRMAPFLSLYMGNPFWAHGKVWIRDSYEAACVLESSGKIASCCNFMIDACDEFVEAIEYETGEASDNPA